MLSLKITLDGKCYLVDDFNHEGKKICNQLYILEQNILRLQNLRAVLSKAKNAYIGDIKSTVIESKVGIDLNSLFDVP